MRYAFFFAFMIAVWLVPVAVFAQATFTVTTTANSGPGSLQQAILDANARGGRDRIVFDIPGNHCDAETGVCTIAPGRNLPEVTGAVEIDGLTQPGADCDVWPPRLLVEVTGRQIDEQAQGAPGMALTLTGGSSLVRGLVFNEFNVLHSPTVSARGLRVEGDDSVIECNIIGLTADGTARLPDAMTFELDLSGNDNVTVRNVLEGHAVLMGDRNRIQGNYAGLSADGLTPTSESDCSMSILGSENLVGGVAPGEGNVICGISLFGTNEHASARNRVVGNLMGTNAAGERTRGGTLSLSVSRDNQVGGTEPGEGNLVAGSINLFDVHDNIIQGNYVGVDPTGTTAFDTPGTIRLSKSSGNLIGGSSPGARNLVAQVIEFSEAHRNVLQGNYVGVDPTGMTPLAARDGLSDALSLFRSSDNLIGGTGEGEGNVIVGTFTNVILSESSDNRILGNRIGTGTDGMQTLSDNPNGLFRSVILRRGSARNTIGGPSPGAANVIASSRSGALVIEDASRENAVLGNFIGTDPTGTIPLESFGPGIVLDSVFSNVIGSPTAPNTIAYQLEDGILVTGGGADNTLSANHIYRNGGLGINLDGGTEDALGVTANNPDGNDDPALPNSLQNYPELTLQTIDGTEVTLGVTLESRPNTRFRIEVFASDACDASGYGEGARFLMAQDVTVSSSGQSTLSLSVDASEGDNALTATATDDAGNTSEFSACLILSDNAAPTASTITQPADGAEVAVGGTTTPVDPSETLTVAWTEASDPNGDAVTYRWEVAATEAFSEVLYAEDAGAETMLTVSLGTLALMLDGAGIALGASVVLYHRVVASDGSSETVGPVSAVTLVRGMLVAMEDETGLPEAFALEANYPNPFNPQTTISFALPQASEVYLVVYDVLGREVVHLVEGTLPAGRHEAVFDAARLPSGVYLYRLEANDFTQMRRMLLIK